MKETTEDEKRVGRKLLKELNKLLFPQTGGAYVDFDHPRKDIWEAFVKRWGA